MDKSNIIDKFDSIDKPDPIDKSDSKDKSDSIDGEASAKPFHGWSQTHKSNYSEYFISYLILSKFKKLRV